MTPDPIYLLMLLLVSVANGDEAAAARAGGADIIDAKNPFAGPLGAVAPAVLRQIGAVVGRAHPLTAALGDAADEDDVERLAREAAGVGVTFVKLGFAGITASRRIATLLAAARRGAAAGSHGGCGVVAVAYADGDQVAGPGPDRLVDAASAAGVAGVLLDTANKDGPPLRTLLSQVAIAAWISRAHEGGLTAAVAGRLQIADLTFVRDAGADIAGVRGAACEGGRTGRVAADKVEALRRMCYCP